MWRVFCCCLVLFFKSAPTQRGGAPHTPIRICMPCTHTLRALKFKQRHLMGVSKHEAAKTAKRTFIKIAAFCAFK